MAAALAQPAAAAPERRRTKKRLVCIGLGTFIVLGYTAVALLRLLWPYRVQLAAALALAEAAFFFAVWRPRHAALSAAPAKHEPENFNPEQLFRRFIQFCRELPQGVDFQGYVSGWFLNAPYELIKRDNVVEFLAYGFYYRSM